MKLKTLPSVTLFTGGLLLAAAPLAAHADLVYENIHGNSFIYDTTDKLLFTQDANISGTTFTYAGANAWAAGLSLPGFGHSFALPTSDEFRSLFLQMYGTGGLKGGGFEYGATVSFGPGANDHASNVQPEYWTSQSGVDFNFYYGYGGGRTDDQLFSAWAVTAAPEPGNALMGAVTAGLVGSIIVLRRRQTVAA